MARNGLFPALNVEQGDYTALVTRSASDRVLRLTPIGWKLFDMARADHASGKIWMHPSHTARQSLGLSLLVAGDLTNMDTYFQAVKKNLSRSSLARRFESTEARIRRSLYRAEVPALLAFSFAVLLAGVAIALSRIATR